MRDLLIQAEDFAEGVAVASLVDVGLMNLDAVISRGSRKDFVDLWRIARDIPIDELLRGSTTKYSFARDFELMAVESLVRFDNADRDVQAEMLIDLDWKEVRAFFITEAQRLGRQWFDDQSCETEPSVRR